MRSCMLNSLCNRNKVSFWRLPLLVGAFLAFGLPVLAQVGMDTESLLFRSYGDNPAGAVAVIQQPVSKPGVDMPTPTRKPAIESVARADEPDDDNGSNGDNQAATDSERAQSVDQPVANIALPEGMVAAPVPAAKPEALIAWVEQKEKVEQEEKRVEPEVEEKPVETVEDVIEELIQATSVSILPPKKPVIAQPDTGLEKQAEIAKEAKDEPLPVAVVNDITPTEVESVIALIPVPLPKPNVRERPERDNASRGQASAPPVYRFNGDDDRTARSSSPAGAQPKLNRMPKVGRTTNVVIKTRTGIEWLFNVETAVTDDQHRQGLMYRASIPEEGGMLFLYNPPQTVSMWMKNTEIPLDMIFIAPGGRIVKIHESARPGDLRGISSGRSVRAVLEISGGLARELGISEGDQVIHRAL